MKKSLYRLSKSIYDLEISTLSIIAVLVTIDSVMARPGCYFVDANGHRVNLSFVCSQSPIPTKPSVQPPSKPTQEKPLSVPAQNNSQNTNTNKSETSPQAEVKNSQSESEERKIPLFNN